MPGPLRYSLGAVAATSCALLLAGCANPGPPKPPSLHLPKLATGLSAVRKAEKVGLTWHVADGTTDGGTLQTPIEAVICRAVRTTAVAASPCSPVARITVLPGDAHGEDTLPFDLASGPSRLLEYRVTLNNPGGHSAGPSTPAYAASGSAPAAIGTITVAARRNAAEITWATASAPQDEVTLHRTLRTTSSGAIVPAKKPQRTSGSAHSTSEEVDLQAGVDAAALGGTLDRSIHDGDTAEYTATRVRHVELYVPFSTTVDREGTRKELPGGKQMFTIFGQSSPPITFTFHDTEPPAPPQGVELIAGGGFGQPPSIDLSWEASPEADVTGYIVYRAEAGSDSFRRVTDAPQAAPAYRDLTAQAGHTYRYRITAVDRRGNESAPSAVVSGKGD